MWARNSRRPAGYERLRTFRLNAPQRPTRPALLPPPPILVHTYELPPLPLFNTRFVRPGDDLEIAASKLDCSDELYYVLITSKAKSYLVSFVYDPLSFTLTEGTLLGIVEGLERGVRAGLEIEAGGDVWIAAGQLCRWKSGGEMEVSLARRAGAERQKTWAPVFLAHTRDRPLHARPSPSLTLASQCTTLLNGGHEEALVGLGFDSRRGRGELYFVFEGGAVGKVGVAGSKGRRECLDLVR